MKINEIVIVEGKDDTVRVKQAVDCDTIETNGSAINEKTLQAIEHAAEKRGVIILTDPDYPGNKIRMTIEKRVPTAKQAFIDAAVARNKRGKIGVEHAPLDAIRDALVNISTPFDSDVETVSKELLVDLGLIMGPGARERRSKVCNNLKLGYCNGKQLFHRLNAFGVTEEDVIAALKHGG
ncbi:ribonuclease M5 [Macrococcus equipercicus]|uniref:Ribonuclease M5 n=1 Tax=Macrococcus equipercicus TaxID=69967 RepID=A0A9Q9BQQ6_9STAP|nr:ribonuclease M5 [Macrococcus equipercicus]KAA1036185.1 ribonuclease M5 [Macrococcus equipercicus]UTH13744.1 ribonuclease M5 [Macrococcus equipercicus]